MSEQLPQVFNSTRQEIVDVLGGVPANDGVVQLERWAHKDAVVFEEKHELVLEAPIELERGPRYAPQEKTDLVPMRE